MKTYFQISLKVFTVLLTVMLVCVGCGKNGNSASGSGLLGGMSKEDMYNPAKRFTEYKPIYSEEKVIPANKFHNSYVAHSELLGIKILDADGEVKYSDEEAEEYYTHYAVHFFFAYIIATKVAWSGKEEERKSYIDYMKEHLFDVICNLPLDDSYPSDIRETVNKIYYDYKDAALNMSLVERGYGFLKYEYGNNKYIYIYRDKDSGSLMVYWEPHLQ